jgi:hypothetical protein
MTASSAVRWSSNARTLGRAAPLRAVDRTAGRAAVCVRDEAVALRPMPRFFAVDRGALLGAGARLRAAAVLLRPTLLDRFEARGRFGLRGMRCLPPGLAP